MGCQEKQIAAMVTKPSKALAHTDLRLRFTHLYRQARKPFLRLPVGGATAPHKLSPALDVNPPFSGKYKKATAST
jgi:hypothetical protein